jgi:hypothetical protein
MHDTRLKESARLSKPIRKRDDDFIPACRDRRLAFDLDGVHAVLEGEAGELAIDGQPADGRFLRVGFAREFEFHARRVKGSKDLLFFEGKIDLPARAATGVGLSALGDDADHADGFQAIE